MNRPICAGDLSRFRRSISALLGIIMLVCSRSAAQELQLEIASTSLDDTSKIEFRATAVDTQALEASADIGESDHCRIFRGSETGSYDSELRLFRYDLLVKDVFTGQPRWSRFELKAIPTGDFLDQVRELNVTITWGRNVERGHIALPLHSLSNDQYLSATPSKDPTEVRLGTDQTIRVNLANKLKAMKLVIQSVRVSYGDPNLWDSKPLLLTPTRVLDEQGVAPLDGLTVRANPRTAIPTTFFRLKNAEDTQLNLAIIYAPQSGGKRKELPVVIKIRFVPSMPYLALVLVLGAVLGTIGRLVDERQREMGAWAQVVLSAVAAALILEVVGIALISLNSEFKIFGVVLDPFQIPQVLLLGLLVGLLGVNIATTVREIVQKNKSTSGGQTAPEGGPK